MIDVGCHGVLGADRDLAGGVGLAQIRLDHGEVVVVHLAGGHIGVGERLDIRRDDGGIQLGVLAVLPVAAVDVVARQRVEVVLRPSEDHAVIGGLGLHGHSQRGGGVDVEAEASPVLVELQVPLGGASVGDGPVLDAVGDQGGHGGGALPRPAVQPLPGHLEVGVGIAAAKAHLQRHFGVHIPVEGHGERGLACTNGGDHLAVGVPQGHGAHHRPHRLGDRLQNGALVQVGHGLIVVEVQYLLVDGLLFGLFTESLGAPVVAADAVADVAAGAGRGDAQPLLHVVFREAVEDGVAVEQSVVTLVAEGFPACGQALGRPRAGGCGLVVGHGAACQNGLAVTGVSGQGIQINKGKSDLLVGRAEVGGNGICWDRYGVGSAGNEGGGGGDEQLIAGGGSARRTAGNGYITEVFTLAEGLVGGQDQGLGAD